MNKIIQRIPKISKNYLFKIPKNTVNNQKLIGNSLKFIQNNNNLLQNFRNLNNNVKFQFCLSSSNSRIDSNMGNGKESTNLRSFQHIKKEYLEHAQESLTRIMQQDSSLVDKMCKEFFNNFYPIKDNNKLQDIFFNLLIQNKNKKNNQQIIQEVSFGGSETDIDNKLKETANQLVIDFKIIFEVLDKAYLGFLLGDITPKLFTGMQKSLLKTLQIYETVQDQIGHDALLQQMYTEIRKYTTMGLFKLPENGIKHADLETKRNLYERQLILEEESHELALDKFGKVFEDMQNMNMTKNMEGYKRYIKDWFPNLCKAIQQEQQACKFGQNSGDRKYYGKYISIVPSEKLAMICLSEFLSQVLQLSQRWKVQEENLEFFRSSLVSKSLYDKIGKQINLEVIYNLEEIRIIKEQKEQINKFISEINDSQISFEEMKSENPGLSDDEINQKLELIKRQMDDKVNSQIMYQQKRTQMQKDYLKESIQRFKFNTQKHSDQGIPLEVQYKLGAFLVHLMKETIKIKNQDGFLISLIVPQYKKISVAGGKTGFVGILNINENFLSSLLEQSDKTDSPFIHIERSLPMIFPPAKWKDSEIGGYYKRPTLLMRLPEGKTQENNKALKYARLNQMFEVLDIVGETPWRINKKIYHIMNAIWEEGGGKGGIPIRKKDNKDFVYDFHIKECKDPKKKKQLMRIQQDQKDQHSLRCDFTLKINQARAFLDVQKIYFPHNVDFRGRIYPIPPHLNHMGEDKCRGLLEFSEGKRLGKRGVYWLQIHVANLMGKDKLSFQERFDYVNEDIEKIKRNARDPLKYRDWLEFDDPWQALSAMIDYVQAIDSGDPENYVSHMHIHQDGSCNGLQHYAALGRDIDGAKQVNLMNSERPGDLYSHVARMVEQKVNAHAADKEHKYHAIAVKLVGNIKRKTVKQTVMTSVYGVTFIGARQQILKQLRDKTFLDHNENEPYMASFYLAHITLEAIKDLFSQAHLIKQWLIKCAQLIAMTQNPVSWITPLGLPVIQPYRKSSSYDVIKTATQTVSISKSPEDLPINKSKQQTAFPPNFVHSLDSSHLMYTARQCKKENIAFASVHDSYWTHAADVDRMNTLLREQFVQLHSEPLLENLLDSFKRRYPKLEFPPIPQRGNLDLEHVKTSDYFFA